jgi:hypothetical protein
MRLAQGFALQNDEIQWLTPWQNHTALYRRGTFGPDRLKPISA